MASGIYDLFEIGDQAANAIAGTVPRDNLACWANLSVSTEECQHLRIVRVGHFRIGVL